MGSQVTGTPLFIQQLVRAVSLNKLLNKQWRVKGLHNWSFVRGTNGNGWTPLPKGQLCGKCSQVMNSKITESHPMLHLCRRRAVFNIIGRYGRLYQPQSAFSVNYNANDKNATFLAFTGKLTWPHYDDIPLYHHNMICMHLCAYLTKSQNLLKCYVIMPLYAS